MRKINYEKIDSTQKEIWRRIENKTIENKTVIIADIQTDAIGTHGRTWYTDEKNNIAFSIYLNPNVAISKLDGLTYEIAQILVNIFKEEYNVNLDIKKPNDLVYNEKKLGGILTETKLIGEKVKHLVIGIGINTNKDRFPDEISKIASSVKKEFGIVVDNKKIIDDFLIEFEKNFKKRIEEK